MTSFRTFLIIVFGLLAAGCGMHSTEPEEQSALAVVQAADGSLYSIPCLRQIAGTMESEGSSAMESCKVSAANESSKARGTHGYNSYAYIYYPPSYYSQNYWNSYCTTSYSCSTSYYNPYKNYQNSSPFCAYVFGSSYSNWNCYYILGYTAQTYTNYYQPSCSPCYTTYGSGYYCPNSNSCWNSGYVTPYYW